MKNLLSTIILFLAGHCLAAQSAIDWQKSLGGTENDYARAIQQTTDGGYIVAGYPFSIDGDVIGHHGERDFWVVKLTNAGDIEWQKALGGTGDDLAFSIQQTSDGGYIVAGHTSSIDGDITSNNGSIDYWVIKLTSTGAIEWQKSLGGSDSDFASSIQQTSDGGYIVGGNSNSSDGDVTVNQGKADFWIVKLTNSGAIEWQKSLGGSDSDFVTSIQQTSDGGYIVGGYSDSTDGDVTGNHGYYDFWVVKLTNSGAIEWQKSLGGAITDVVASIQQTSDGGYIVAGYSNSTDGDVTGNHGYHDFWVVKLTDSGAIDWQKSLGGSGYDIARSIQQTSDGGYIVAGSSDSSDGDVTGNHGSSDMWVVKLTNSGAIDWQKSLGGTDSDGASSIQQTSDSGYISAGSSESSDGDVTSNQGGPDFWIVKLSSDPNSVNENPALPMLSVFPNPASKLINLKTNPELSSVVYTVYDMMGKVVLSEKIINEYTEVELSNLASGIFIIQIQTENKIVTARFVKE